MAVSVTEDWRGRGGGFDADLMKWVSTRVYEVAFCPDEFTARASIPIALNDVHPLNANLKCVNIDAKPAGFNFYRVTCKFIVPPGGDATSSDDPLSQPIKISWEPSTWSEMSEIDAEGNPLVNCAGDPLEPQSMEWPTIQLVVRKNVPAYDPSVAVTYQSAINSDTFQISGNNINLQIPPGQCRCRGIRPEEEYTLNATFNTIIARFDFRPNNTDQSDVAADAWDLRILNAGYNCYYDANEMGDDDDVNAQLGPIYFNGDKVTSPVPLDDAGVPIGDGYTVTAYGYTPIESPAVPNVEFEYQTVGGDGDDDDNAVTLVYLHYKRGKSLPFTGLV